MSQYYYTDGKERYGPFTIDQLRERNLTCETLVWKEGMSDWQPAKNQSDLNALFFATESFQPPASIPYSPPLHGIPPKNWLIESIIVTLICCLPLGIVAIINATKVETLWNNGQRDAALKASQEAGKWVKIGLIIAVVFWGLYFIALFFGIVAGLGSGFSE